MHQYLFAFTDGQLIDVVAPSYSRARRIASGAARAQFTSRIPIRIRPAVLMVDYDTLRYQAELVRKKSSFAFEYGRNWCTAIWQ